MKYLLAIPLCLVCSLAQAQTTQRDAGDLARAVVSACGCSIISARIGNAADKTTWGVQYDPSATSAQIAAGNAALQAFDITAPKIPLEVSAMQAKVALSRAGLLTATQNWVNAQSAETQLIWNTATVFQRNSALIAQAATALGLTSAQVDQLFITAAAINP